MDLEYFEQLKELENKKPKINITQYGYNPTIPCFPQLVHIWELIGEQYKIEKEYLILPDDILTEIVQYCMENSNKFPMSWWLYPNSIISRKPYILKPFKGVFSQSDLDDGIVDLDDKQSIGLFDQRVMAHQIMASPLKNYKRPMFIGTQAEIQYIANLLQPELEDTLGTVHDIIFVVTDNDRERILGEEQWQLS